jgi:hypothetical protein
MISLSNDFGGMQELNVSGTGLQRFNDTLSVVIFFAHWELNVAFRKSISHKSDLVLKGKTIPNLIDCIKELLFGVEKSLEPN